MIDYKYFQLACPPHTGSTWCIKACALAGLGEVTKTHLHKPFPSDGLHSVLRVSTIRHPADWLMSYFQNAGHVDIPIIDVMLPIKRTSNSFTDFVRRIVDEMPGQVGRVMLSYKADTYIRTDELNDGFSDFLVSLGCDVSKVLSLEYQNKSVLVSNARTHLAGALFCKLMDSEYDFVDQFQFV